MKLAQKFGCIALPLMTALGGCTTTNNANKLLPEPLTTASTARTPFTAKQSAILNQAFNDTVASFEKIGFGWEIGTGPRAQREF
ncbi:MAG: hypothetical protein LRY36_01660, partial [Alphaproteobacteria bacterium]|nr:hypothetical protein [Alphaproteobacteria bacterium]